MAPAVEDSAGIDDHARRVDLSGHHSLGFDFNASLGKNHSIETARDDHTIALDLTFDLCALTQDHGLLRDDVAFHVAVNAKRAGDCERSFERHALVYESCPFFAGAILRGCGPLPCHIISPKFQTHPL